MEGGSYTLQATAGQPATQIAGDGHLVFLGPGFWPAARNEAVALPVEMTAMDATLDGEAVRLVWQTASETNNAGFEVERRNSSEEQWTNLGFVDGAGTTRAPQTYRFEDADLPFETDTLVYRLKQIDVGGSFAYSDEVEVAQGAPERLALHPNFPNPFSQRTTLRYEVPTVTAVQLAVYDALGRRVAVLVREEQAAGRKELTFDARGLPSGLYFVRLTSEGAIRSRKITVVR